MDKNFRGVGKEFLDSRRIFAFYTVLKSAEESVKTAPLNDSKGFEGMDSRCDSLMI